MHKWMSHTRTQARAHSHFDSSFQWTVVDMLRFGRVSLISLKVNIQVFKWYCR